MRKYLPVYIDITDKKILIVGAGSVARQKIEALSPFGGDITVLAPEVPEDIARRVKSVLIGKYEEEKLLGIDIVYACTNETPLNCKIKEDSEKRGILVNVVDDPKNSDFISPAVFVKDNIMVAVSSGGTDVKKSIRVRDKIQEILRDDIV